MIILFLNAHIITIGLLHVTAVEEKNAHSESIYTYYILVNIILLRNRPRRVLYRYIIYYYYTNIGTYILYGYCNCIKTRFLNDIDKMFFFTIGYLYT